MSNEFLYLMAIGDAAGMPYEFVAHDGTVAKPGYRKHPTYEEYEPGHYTDDTQMAAANAGLLLRDGNPMALTADDFVNAWLATYRADPRPGYSRYMQHLLQTSNDAAGFIGRLDASRGVTSGAAMRAGPFGLLRDVQQVITLTGRQARVTHNTPAGLHSALTVSLTVHFLHHGGNRAALPGFLEQYLGADWNGTRYGNADDPGNGLKIVTQALDVLQRSHTLSAVLLNGINHASISDTDTLCALAMLMASRCMDIANDLPPALIDGLEDGPRGGGFLQTLDRKLLAAYPAVPLYKRDAGRTSAPAPLP